MLVGVLERQFRCTISHKSLVSVSFCLFVLNQINGEFVAGYSEDKINKVFRKAPADKIVLAIRERLVISI